MTVYDDIIKRVQALLTGLMPAAYPYKAQKCAEPGDKNQLILGKESAYELGASGYDSVNFVAVTESEALVPRDETLVYGAQLRDISSDCSYARITLLRTDDIAQNGEQGAYSIIKSIEMKKYDGAPEGFMLRASALSNREQVRVSKAAIKAGLSFEQVGNLFIKRYKENPHVLAVQQIFVTAPSAPFSELDKLATSANEITRALNHILADLKMDCHACEWKIVCDEVDGMKQMHEKLIQK